MVQNMHRSVLRGQETMRHKIAIKRAYEDASAEDGTRFLVERLWPRGIRKADLPLDAWLKDVAPSTELRKWFAHDPSKWSEFRKRYARELDANPSAWQPILDRARHGRVTLVFSSHDEAHNNAVVLKEYLDERLRSKPANTHRPAA
jgi:uncharacterized protein YeaO (DUF488 family)